MMRARHHDLDGAAGGIGNDGDRLGRHAVQPADRLGAQRRRLRHALIVGVGGEHHIQRQPSRPGVFAADDLGEIGEFHRRCLADGSRLIRATGNGAKVDPIPAMAAWPKCAPSDAPSVRTSTPDMEQTR